MRCILQIFILTLYSYFVFGQFDPDIENLNFQDDEKTMESNAEEINEVLISYYKTPLDINKASEYELNESGLFTAFQVYGLLKHRKKYGTIFSIYELASLPGFSQTSLLGIEKFLCVDSEYRQNSASPKGYLMSNISRKLPDSGAYRKKDGFPPEYQGSANKISTRFKYSINKWNIGFAYEKDAGEIWRYGVAPEHFSGYLEFTGNSFLRKIIIGNFRIHRGLGLVYGSGFSSRSRGVHLDGYRLSKNKAFASCMEYGYLNGISTSASLKKWNCDAFISFKPEDISLYRIEDGDDLFEKIRETGIHRSISERNGRNLISQLTSGISLNRSFKHAYAGMQFTSGTVLPREAGKDSIADWSAFNNKRQNTSIYFVSFGDKYDLYAEFAIGKTWQSAFLIGAELAINPALTFSASFRRYAPDYAGLSPQAYCSGSNVRNEQGINAKFSLTPFPGSHIILLSDFSRELDFLDPEYTPGIRRYYFLNGSYRLPKDMELECRITSKSTFILSKESATPGREYTDEGNIRGHLQLKIPASKNFELAWRGARSDYIIDKKRTTGMLSYFQLRYKDRRIQGLTYRFTMFNIPEWENRIYVYEPGVRYSFQFPAYAGKGYRNSVVFVKDFCSRFTVRAKGGCTVYSHVSETGTGKDIRPGNKVWDFEIQLQADLYAGNKKNFR